MSVVLRGTLMFFVLEAPSTALRAVPSPAPLRYAGEDEEWHAFLILPRGAGEGDRAKRGGGGPRSFVLTAS
jgi:hypothetical protein